MTTTISNNFQSTRRPSSSSMRMMATSCSPPPSLSFSSVLYSPTMNDGPSDELLNGDKRSAHNALERQRREGLNNKFQQLAHVLPGLQNVRRPSKSMIVTKSLEFVSKAVQRDSSYQNKIKQLRKEYQTLRKHTQQQQHLYKKVPSPSSSSLLAAMTTTTTKKRPQQEEEAATIAISPSKRRQKQSSTSSQMTISAAAATAAPVTNKKLPSPIRHKFVHHHASASSSPEMKTTTTTTTTTTTLQQQQPKAPQVQTQVHYPNHPPMSLVHEFANMQPSWPLLDMSGVSFMDYSQQQQQPQPQFSTTSIPFFTTTATATPLSFYPTDPSYSYFWK